MTSTLQKLLRTAPVAVLALLLVVVSCVRLLPSPPPAPAPADEAPAADEDSDRAVGNIMDPTPLDLAGEVTSLDDTLMAPYGTTVLSITDRGIQAYWKKIEGAVGYEVARAYRADDRPEHLAYVTKGSFTYTDDSFNHDVGKVYYFVRGLSGGDGAYAAGPWSKPIEAHFLKKLQLSRTKWFLPRGDTYQFEASYGWGNAPGVTWASSDEAVATIGETGLLRGLSAGTTTVRCTSEQLGQSAEAEVTVDRPEQPMLADYEPRYVQAADGSWSNPAREESRDAVLVMAGDLMCMGPQLTTHYSEDRGYDFNECYRYVKPLFEGADLAVGNLETMVASAYPYNGESGYINGKPVCNAPARYLDALRYGGFDLLCMANNHNADVGQRGVGMTLAQVDRYQFARTGLFASADEERTLLVDVGGIKVGFVAYVDQTCGYNGQDRMWDADEVDTMLNYYSPERAKADIARLRERGAEYVIAYLHWGVKNHFDPVEGQEQTAHELADLGVNYIVGSHPHLIQRFETIVSSEGKKVPCIYSVGDFNSYIHQVEGNLDSILMRIRLHRTKDGRVILAENAYIPCHIYAEYGEERYVTMPMDKALNGGVKTPSAKAILAGIARQVGEDLPRYEPVA